MALCLLWDAWRILLYLTLVRILLVHKSRIWSLAFTGFVVFHIMVLPASSLTTTYTNGHISPGGATSEMLESDKYSPISSLSLDLNPSLSSSTIHSPGGLFTTNEDYFQIAVSPKWSSSHTINKLESAYALTSTQHVDTSYSSNKATQVPISPSFILSPAFLITTNPPVEKILMSDLNEWESITVEPLRTPYLSTILQSYLKLSLNSSETVTSGLDQVTIASSFDDSVSSESFNYQIAAGSTPSTNIENVSSERAEHSTCSQSDAINPHFRTDSVEIFRTARFAEGTHASTTAQTSSKIKPSRVIPTESTGEFSYVLTFSDGGSWSMAEIMSILASQQLATLATSPNDQQAVVSPPVNNTNNLISHVEDKEWAVPAVATLASVTFVAVVILIIVCGRHYRKKACVRRSNMSLDGESQLTTFPQHRHQQKQPYCVPGGQDGGHISPKYDNSPASLGRPATRHGRQPWSSLPRNESREYFEMFDLEKSRQDKMEETDNVDYGEEWTTKFVQEKRLYDYGLGNHRLQNGSRTHQGEGAEILGISPISTPGTPRRDPLPVFGAAPRFAKQSATLSLEEARWSDAQRLMNKVHTIPPVKPKRVYAYDKHHIPEPSYRQHLVGFDNRGFSSELRSCELYKGQAEKDVEHNGNSDCHINIQSKSYILPNITHEVQRRNLPTVAERPHRILKCASYDESKLSAEAKPNEARVRPTRKISTVSEPPREYLTVPESGILKSRWMYPSVDNLDQIGFREGHASSSRTACGNETLKNHESECLDNQPGSPKVRDAQPTTSGVEASTANCHFTRPTHDFVFPIISKASKKILEIRTSRKLGDVRRLDSSDPCENMAWDTGRDQDSLKNSLNGSNMLSQGSAKVPPNVPKIIFTNESEEGDDVAHREQTSASVSKRVRKIARVNNPFLIEIDQTVANKSEKYRRASAPSMPYNLDPKTHLLTSIGITRSSSSELLRVPDITSSKRSARTSRELYDLLNRAPEHDPEQRLMVKKMIDDRYEALFGKKYTGIAVTDQLDSLSPRLVKSRQAAKSKASSLERDSQSTHYVRYAPDRENETETSHLAFRSDSRPHSDELWRHSNSSPVSKQSESVELRLRKSLTDGTDGCDNLSIESSSTSAGPVKEIQEERCLETEDKVSRIIEDGQRRLSRDAFEPAVDMEEINQDTSAIKESYESRESSQSYTDSTKGHPVADQCEKIKSASSCHSRLTGVSENTDTAQAIDDIGDVSSANPGFYGSRKGYGQAERMRGKGHDSLHSLGGSNGDISRNTDDVSSVLPKTSILPTISFDDIPFHVSKQNVRQSVVIGADVANQGQSKTVSRIDEDLKSGHISRTTKMSPPNKHTKHGDTTQADLNENVERSLESFPSGSQKDIPGSDANITHAQTVVSLTNTGKMLAADDMFHQPLNMEDGTDFSEGLHDSIPSSRDISFIDTSEEDNKDVSFDMEYFDSLLSSSV